MAQSGQQVDKVFRCGHVEQLSGRVGGGRGAAHVFTPQGWWRLQQEDEARRADSEQLTLHKCEKAVDSDKVGLDFLSN